jgi:hypothetical protein
MFKFFSFKFVNVLSELRVWISVKEAHIELKERLGDGGLTGGREEHRRVAATDFETVRVGGMLENFASGEAVIETVVENHFADFPCAPFAAGFRRLGTNIPR